MSKTEAAARAWADLPVIVNRDHPKLYQKQLVRPADADKLQAVLHAVLFERLGCGGAVLPHDHDCGEIICITKGEVEVYYRGGWHHQKAGDTLLIPAGEVHSVYNRMEEESEQISIFLPAVATAENHMFVTEILDGVSLPTEDGKERMV